MASPKDSASKPITYFRFWTLAACHIFWFLTIGLANGWFGPDSRRWGNIGQKVC